MKTCKISIIFMSLFLVTSFLESVFAQNPLLPCNRLNRGPCIYVPRGIRGPLLAAGGLAVAGTGAAVAEQLQPMLEGQFGGGAETRKEKEEKFEWDWPCHPDDADKYPCKKSANKYTSAPKIAKQTTPTPTIDEMNDVQ